MALRVKFVTIILFPIYLGWKKLVQQMVIYFARAVIMKLEVTYGMEEDVNVVTT